MQLDDDVTRKLKSRYVSLMIISFFVPIEKWKAVFERRHGRQFVVLSDCNNLQADHYNYFQWDIRKILINDELKTAVFVAGKQCTKLPFDSLPTPVRVQSDALSRFLHEFADAPLCDTVFRRPMDAMCERFRELRSTQCSKCAEGTKAVKKTRRSHFDGAQEKLML